MVSFPKWILVIFLPIFVGGLGGYATSRFNAGRDKAQLDYVMKRQDIMEQTKVDRNEFQQIEKLLIRIEGKVDDHIKVHK